MRILYGDDEYKKIFCENLNFFINLRGKSQTDIINDLDVNKSAMSSWCNGTRLPRMNKLVLLANYLNIPFGELVEDRNNQTTTNKYKQAPKKGRRIE